jgi:hypothetical protein
MVRRCGAQVRRSGHWALAVEHVQMVVLTVTICWWRGAGCGPLLACVQMVVRTVTIWLRATCLHAWGAVCCTASKVCAVCTMNCCVSV